MGGNIEGRARALLAKYRARSGNGGHATTYSLAMHLVHGFLLGEETALSLLAEWNRYGAEPPWTERELKHKVRCAAQAIPHDGPGYLLRPREEDAR
jgi:hypothetical protein